MSSRKTKLLTTSPCPRCRVRIEKNEGCTSMQVRRPPTQLSRPCFYSLFLFPVLYFRIIMRYAYSYTIILLSTLVPEPFMWLRILLGLPWARPLTRRLLRPAADQRVNFQLRLAQQRMRKSESCLCIFLFLCVRLFGSFAVFVLGVYRMCARYLTALDIFTLIVVKHSITTYVHPIYPFALVFNL